mmetsp:Transcript_20412/g.78461  ORF Transcript_20412/g.78461 Transcript_20412/m.78461 type:complete len:231 (+) Transcript_20412:1900-2592(+)
MSRSARRCSDARASSSVRQLARVPTWSAKLAMASYMRVNSIPTLCRFSASVTGMVLAASSVRVGTWTTRVTVPEAPWPSGFTRRLSRRKSTLCRCAGPREAGPAAAPAADSRPWASLALPAPSTGGPAEPAEPRSSPLPCCLRSSAVRERSSVCEAEGSTHPPRPSSMACSPAAWAPLPSALRSSAASSPLPPVRPPAVVPSVSLRAGSAPAARKWADRRRSAPPPASPA